MGTMFFWSSFKVALIKPLHPDDIPEGESCCVWLKISVDFKQFSLMTFISPTVLGLFKTVTMALKTKHTHKC